MTSGFFGSITMSVAPVSASTVRIAFHVPPPSVVLYTPRSPPLAQSGPIAVTYTTFELRGSTMTFWMCSEFSSPMRLNVLPASVDL